MVEARTVIEDAVSDSPLEAPAGTLPRSRSGRAVALLLLGTFLLQSAWIIALPPFRGTDEFDHAYRAAAVAHGEWRGKGVPAQHGRGSLVVVPRSLVDAATPVCASYLYTGPDNCYPVADAGRGYVTVASAAWSYNPVFYAVIGAASTMSDGAPSLYAMRVSSALLCAFFVGLAGWATTLWARTRWPVFAMVLSMTPVMLFSLAVAAPNGLEMSAALALWCSLLALVRLAPDDPRIRLLIGAATLSGVVLAPLRLLGPLWLALIVGTFVVVAPAQLTRVLRRHPWHTGMMIGLMTVSTLAAIWWTKHSTTASVGPGPEATSEPGHVTLRQIPLWFFQAIAAFPRRMDPAPPLVYVTIGLVTLALITVGFTAATRATKLGMTVVFVAAVTIPVVITAVTVASAGPLWQGRYGLPFHIGVILLAGAALDRKPPRHRLTGPLVTVAWVCLILGQAASVLGVLANELSTSPLRDSSEWVRLPAWVLALLVIAGCACYAASTHLTHREKSVDGPHPTAA